MSDFETRSSSETIISLLLPLFYCLSDIWKKPFELYQNIKTDAPKVAVNAGSLMARNSGADRLKRYGETDPDETGWKLFNHAAHCMVFLILDHLLVKRISKHGIEHDN